MLRQRDKHNSALNNQYQQRLPLKVGHQEDQVAKLAADPLNYHYFKALFVEVVETKIEEPRGRLTRLIKFTTGEARELIKHCIQLPHNRGYQHARALLERTYGNPHKILSSYQITFY